MDGPEGRVERVIDKPFAAIGCHQRADVVLEHEEVPVKGLYFHATDEGVFCVDLSPMVEGQERVRGWLAPGEAVSLGPYRISVGLVPPPDAADVDLPDLESEESCTAPHPLLSLTVEGREAGNTPIIRRLTMVGRERPSKIRLSSRSVSTCHCALYRDAASLWVVDLLSFGGTWVDGRSIEVARLLPGGSFRVGRAELAYPIELTDRHPESAAGVAPESAAGRLTDVARLQELAAALAADREDFERQLADWVEKRSRLEQEASQRAARLEQERQELEAARQALEADRFRWREDRARLEEDLARRSHELSDQQEQVQAEQRRLEASLFDRQHELEARDAQRQEAIAECDAQLASIHALRAQFDDREAALRQREEEAARLASAKQDLERERRDWESRQQQVEKEICEQSERLAAERAGLDAARRTEEAQWSAQMTAVTELRGELERERQAIREAHQRWVQEEEGRQSQWQSRTDELRRQGEALAAAAAETRRQRQLWEEQQADAEADWARRQDEFERRLERLRDQEQAFQAEKEQWQLVRQEEDDRLADQAAQLDQQALRLAEEREELSSSSRSRQQDCVRLEGELAERARRLAEQAADLETGRRQLEAERQEQAEWIERREQEELAWQRRSDEQHQQQQQQSGPSPADAPHSESEPEEQTLPATTTAVRPDVPSPRGENRDAEETDEDQADEIFNRLTDQLVNFRQSKTRWHRIKQAILRCFG